MIECPEDSSNCSSNELRAELTKKTLRKLYLAMGLCTIFMMIELVGGYFANSLAIVSDAVHLLTDIAGFLTSVVAIIISKKSANLKYTFGFQRAQTLGALASIAFVWILTAYLIIEAIERIKNPEEINGKLMFFIALFGVAVNIILAFSLEHGHSHSDDHHLGQNENNLLVEEIAIDENTRKTTEDINLRAAFIHVLGDLVQSVGVLIASGIIWYNKNWRIADPICTLFFSLIVMISTIFISRDILRILMEGTPKNIKVADILEDLMNVEGVSGAHDLHVWTISPGNVALTVHITIISEPIGYCQEQILSQIQEILCSKYTIHHSTIQVEKKESIHCKPAFCVNNEIQ